MAHDAIAFLIAMDLDRVDLLGFSIGSFVAQEIALIRPGILNRLVLASSAPQGAAGMHGWAPEVIGAVGGLQPGPEQYLSVFFPARLPAGKLAGGPAAHVRQNRGPGPGDHLGDPQRPVRRGLHLGNPRPRAAAASSVPSTCRCSSPTATATR